MKTKLAPIEFIKETLAAMPINNLLENKEWRNYYQIDRQH
jgi:hypothetical protein